MPYSWQILVSCHPAAVDKSDAKGDFPPVLLPCPFTSREEVWFSKFKVMHQVLTCRAQFFGLPQCAVGAHSLLSKGLYGMRETVFFNKGLLGDL